MNQAIIDFKSGKWRYNRVKTGPKMSPLNQFLTRNMPPILRDLDKKGESISARRKYEVVVELILNPENFVQYLTPEDRDHRFTMEDLGKDIKKINKSSFLRRVYPTSKIFLFLVSYKLLKRCTF